MADCSLDELLAEVGDLSIIDDCSGTIKDCKKNNDCSLFDALWSDDETSEVETSLNLTEIYSLNFSVDETDNIPLPALLSSNNVTVRRKTKTKRHISEDDKHESVSDHSKDILVDPGSPPLEDLTSFSRFTNVPIGLHQENAGLDSTIDDKSPDVCRKLNNDFEQAGNPNLGTPCSFPENHDSQAYLKEKLENTKQDGTDEDVELSIRECNSYVQVSPETIAHPDGSYSAKSEEFSENHTTKEAVTSSCKKNKSDTLTNSFSPVTTVKFQSDILVPSKIKNNNIQDVFEPKRELNNLLTNLKQRNLNTCTRGDESFTFSNSLDNESNIVRSCDDESTTSNECISHQIIKHRESTNFEHRTGQCLDVETDFKVPDKNVPEFRSCNTDSVSSFSINSQLKTDSREKSPLSCRLSSSHAVGTDALLSNKENLWKTEPEKKIIISSDSDSDSVWEDALDFDDSDCEKYNISLSSRLGRNPSHERNEKITKEIETGNSTTKLSNDWKPSASSRSVQLSESDDDDDFENFLDQIKTPKPKSTPRYSLNSFIVDDRWVDSSEDDDNDNDEPFLFTTPKCITNVPIVTPSTAPAKKTTLATLNERCLPARKFNTPSLKATPLKTNTKDNTPTQTSSSQSLKKIVTPYVNTPHKFWRKSRELLIDELFKCYNETIFNNKLPADLPIIWNKQMTKTAGFCYYIGSMNKKCRIELSDKVVDSCDRLRDTLIHELCHAATWLIDGVKAGHGPHWKRWAHKARMVHSDLPPISRCHSYDINYKFTYRCVKCQHSFGRHSKSVNLRTARCPYCLSHLELLPRLNKDGTPAKTRAPTKFSLFVKDYYAKIKAKEPGFSHQQVMKELSKQFALQATSDRDNLTKST